MTDPRSPQQSALSAVKLPADHPPVKAGKIGVLLLNLGTPEATDYWSMRRYLKQFLSDRRVIEVPRLIWWPVLNLIVLTKRPKAKGKDYDSIWNKELNEGPLKTITRNQATRLALALSAEKSKIIIDWAMRYGKPDVDSVVKRMVEEGCERILAIPLYPQYAAATTATACDDLFKTLMSMRRQPAIRIAPPYHDDATYIDAIAGSITKGLAKLDFEPEVIITSFHGVPKSYLIKGDPYHCHCAKTHRLLCEALGMGPDKLMLTFQSRFGSEEWLQPYTDKTVEALAQKGIKKLAIVAPGFSADCLETLEELDVENREIFMHNGGEHFAYIPCLNESDAGMRVIETIARRELKGWIE